MGKGAHFGWHVTGPGRPTGNCVACRRRITWGQRCEDCKQRLRLRQRRKLKR
jgi:hypothetical protein